jgi:transposase
MRSLRKYCREYEANELINLLRTVPGIGFVVAVTLYLEIIDICRFKDLDHIASFVGFVPSVDSSGDVEKVLGLTKRRCRYLRSLLVEAARIAVRKDPAMTFAFNKLTKRMSSQRAIIHNAKKLLNRIRYVWKNMQPYVPAVIV